MDKLIVITGQTATGKTSLAHKLALEKNGELINADSRQIYKHLDIVTGKERLADVPIWLYDVVEPNTPFSSSEYAQHTRRVIKEIHSRGKTPIIVGGTYLYIKNLLYGFETESIGPDWNLREELNTASLEDLQMRLMDMNYDMFDSMNNSDQNNPRRLIRRIEILSHPDPSVSASRRIPQDDKGLAQNDIEIIGLRFADDEKLRATIEKRVRSRIAAGAIEETRNLLSMDYKKTDPGLQTIGYKQIIQFLEGEILEEEMIALWITAEVQYAKRQYTFMKTNSAIAWHTI
ncbi:MAG: tRNA (adenosine(37)-N6)-dimethylallyltransferase MiaA [Microgenomates group bacterium]